MISYTRALEIISKHATALPPVKVRIENAINMIAAEDTTSPETVPPFNNSAMDGFAAISTALQQASELKPVILKVIGSTVAGDTADAGASGAWEIMTGAPVPKGYDAIVRVEDTKTIKEDENGRPLEISVNAGAKPKANIRDAGEDFQIGDPVIQAGTTITPEHIMAFASLGIANIAVQQKISTSVISTGRELVDDISTPLKSGQIRNSNAPYLLSALLEMGVDANYAGTIHDEPQVFEDKIKQLITSLPESHSDNPEIPLESSKDNSGNDGQLCPNIIISTGAVSMGRYDFIPDSLRKLGAEILFHKVAIRPGKPILFAKFPCGTHSCGTFYFGLPGNPISAAIGLRFFAYPLIRKLQNLEAESPINARLSMPSKKKQGLRFFRKARVEIATGGKLQLEILNGQESFKIHPLLKANCWAEFTEEQTGLEFGDAINIYPLTPNKWNLENASWK